MWQKTLQFIAFEKITNKLQSVYISLGYKNLIKECIITTEYTEKRILDIGLDLVVKPTMNVLGIKLKNPSKVVKKLTDFGWKVNKMERLAAIRIVLMPQVTKKIIDNFIPDLEKVCREIGELWV